MKKITLIIPENYSNVMSITLVGGVGTPMINTLVRVVDLSKGTYIVIPEEEEKVIQASEESDSNDFKSM